MAEPLAPLGFAVGQAIQLVLGGAVRTLDRAEAEADAVSPESLASAASGFLRSALLMLPRGGALEREGWSPVPVSAVEPVTGGTHGSGSGPEAVRLVVSEAGATLHVPAAASSITVRVGDVAAVLHWADGRREVIGHDANRIVVEPTLWPAGKLVVDDIDRVFPGPARVDVGARRPQEIPQPRFEEPSQDREALLLAAETALGEARAAAAS